MFRRPGGEEMLILGRSAGLVWALAVFFWGGLGRLCTRERVVAKKTVSALEKEGTRLRSRGWSFNLVWGRHAAHGMVAQEIELAWERVDTSG